MATLNVVSLFSHLFSCDLVVSLRHSINGQNQYFTHVTHITEGFVYMNYLIYKVMEFLLEFGENQGLCNHTTLRNLHTRSFTSYL